jgi:hypothetical protein
MAHIASNSINGQPDSGFLSIDQLLVWAQRTLAASSSRRIASLKIPQVPTLQSLYGDRLWVQEFCTDNYPE